MELEQDQMDRSYSAYATSRNYGETYYEPWPHQANARDKLWAYEAMQQSATKQRRYPRAAYKYKAPSTLVKLFLLIGWGAVGFAALGWMLDLSLPKVSGTIFGSAAATVGTAVLLFCFFSVFLAIVLATCGDWIFFPTGRTPTVFEIVWGIICAATTIWIFGILLSFVREPSFATAAAAIGVMILILLYVRTLLAYALFLFVCWIIYASGSSPMGFSFGEISVVTYLIVGVILVIGYGIGWYYSER